MTRSLRVFRPQNGPRGPGLPQGGPSDQVVRAGHPVKAPVLADVEGLPHEARVFAQRRVHRWV